MKPICIDLFCGLGGWSEGFLAEGYECIGFDVERHCYPKVRSIKDPESAQKQFGAALKLGEGRPVGAGFNVANEKAYADALKSGFDEWESYPGQLVLQDVLTLHGSQFRNAAVIVASPPCQRYSYMAMPFSRGKAQAAAIRADESGAMLADLNALFNACFRIQREASEAAGRHIPLIVENVRGAQPWVGRAAWNFGSYYLWGDVPALMPKALMREKKTDLPPVPLGELFRATGVSNSWHITGTKVPGFNFHQHEKTGKPGGSFQSAAVAALHDPAGVKQHGSGPIWFDTGIAAHSSKSLSRKAASAQIAKIPFALSNWIAQVYDPRKEAAA